MSFLDGKPWVATEKHCTRWGGMNQKGKYFRCAFCGYKFKPGDTVRCQYTNNIPGLWGNPLVCKDCDDTEKKLISKLKKMKKKKEQLDKELWWFNKRY